MNGELREKFEELFPKDQEAIDGIRPSKSNRSAALVLWLEFSLFLSKELRSAITQAIEMYEKDIEEKVDKLERYFFKEMSGHDFVDTCDIYRLLQKQKQKREIMTTKQRLEKRESWEKEFDRIKMNTCDDCRRVTNGDCGKHGNSPSLMGWKCPKCGRVYSLFVYECRFCNAIADHFSVKTSSTTNSDNKPLQQKIMK